MDKDLTFGQANKLEKFYIQAKKTLLPNGFNLRTGGNGGSKTCEEVKARMRQAHIGIQAGEKHPMFGRKRPDVIARNKLGKGLKVGQ